MRYGFLLAHHEGRCVSFWSQSDWFVKMGQNEFPVSGPCNVATFAGTIVSGSRKAEAKARKRCKTRRRRRRNWHVAERNATAKDGLRFPITAVRGTVKKKRRLLRNNRPTFFRWTPCFHQWSASTTVFMLSILKPQIQSLESIIIYYDKI